MIKLNKITTKTGDSGYSNFKGKKIKKDSAVFKILGDIDQLNSYIGVARSFDKIKIKSINQDLYIIQNKLFDIGSEILAQNNLSNSKSNITKYDLDWLENKQIHYNKSLQELNSFVLPGGNEFTSFLHICRTECRKLERNIVSFKSNDFNVSQNLYNYFNRLSDFFFTISRYVNMKFKTKEQVWIPEIDY